MKGYCYGNGYPEKSHDRAPWFLKHYKSWSHYYSKAGILDDSYLPPVDPVDGDLGEEVDNYYVHKPSTPELVLNPETMKHPINRVTADCLIKMLKRFRHAPVMWDKATKTWVNFSAAAKKITFVRPFVQDD